MGSYPIEPPDNPLSAKWFRVRYALDQFMSEIPDEKTPSHEKGPVFNEPCVGTTGGSKRPPVLFE